MPPDRQTFQKSIAPARQDQLGLPLGKGLSQKPDSLWPSTLRHSHCKHLGLSPNLAHFGDFMRSLLQIIICLRPCSYKGESCPDIFRISVFVTPSLCHNFQIALESRRVRCWICPLITVQRIDCQNWCVERHVAEPSNLDTGSLDSQAALCAGPEIHWRKKCIAQMQSKPGHIYCKTQLWDSGIWKKRDIKKTV